MGQAASFRPCFLYNGDDLCFHLARLEGLKDGILDGQIPVNIQPEGLGGNGYLNAMYARHQTQLFDGQRTFSAVIDLQLHLLGIF